MGKNIIVSEDTIRDLLEAHASLSAWYYELWSALRRANASSNAPDDAARAAFVERMASDFPEVASVARSIRVPRMFVPPPPVIAVPPPAAGAAESGSPVPGEPTTVIEPASARLRELTGQQRASTPGEEPGIAPPPLVIPSEVKYER
jgi:hypothetical protein